MRQLSEREKLNRKIEKNMFYMAFSLCAISILIRVLLIVSYVYFFFFNSANCSKAIVPLVYYSINTLEPIVNIGVFYSFNSIFRQLLNEKVFFKCLADA